MAPTKTVGTRDAASTPQQSLRTALMLQRVARKLGKWKPARGFVIKAHSWEEAEDLWQKRLREHEARP